MHQRLEDCQQLHWGEEYFRAGNTAAGSNTTLQIKTTTTSHRYNQSRRCSLNIFLLHTCVVRSSGSKTTTLCIRFHCCPHLRSSFIFFYIKASFELIPGSNTDKKTHIQRILYLVPSPTESGTINKKKTATAAWTETITRSLIWISRGRCRYRN